MFSCAQRRVSPGWMAGRLLLPLILAAPGILGSRLAAAAPDFEKAQQAFSRGQYDECIAAGQAALRDKADLEDWGVLLTDALLIKGRYPEALKAATNALASENRSLRLRWVAREALLANGQQLAADEMATEIQRLFTSRYWMYRNARDLVIFGRVALLSGMEPKLALDRIYDAARKAAPTLPDAYLASGELALDKHDFALAARFFRDGLQQVPDNADLQFGLARAYAPGDQALMLESLARALASNSNHIGSLLLMTDYLINAEDYPAAENYLARVQSVNPEQPEAWAYRAVIAHLENKPEQESNARERALKYWATNPRVDHLIGLKLSQKYRFAEGAAHQRRALAMAPRYLPAKSQLAQDLLRLGDEREGWRLAEEVQQEDGYDVSANNLVTLHDVLAKFQTLTNAHFVLRMDPREAALYGQRALDLLDQARTRLCATYDMELPKPVLVEMFNEEKDFAVRTFGMPDNDGFLGVCFGRVITANSPGARAGSPFNWESMLWHEFCHVVTLQLTRNKMPRWISEGISVYEERQANPAWGERLNPRYRDMLLSKDLTPVSKLSGAFLAPKTAFHLQFAYYESSLVVQFLVESFGRQKLLAVLHDLGRGTEINEALAKHTVPMPRLEKDFEAYAHKIAAGLAPGVDMEKPSPETVARADQPRGRSSPSRDPQPVIPESAWQIWSKARPTNYWVILRQAERLADEKKWTEAKPLLEKLVRLYPDHTGPGSPYVVLAAAHRELGETNAEIDVLAQYAAKDDKAPDVYLRLMELGTERQEWGAVLTNAQRYLAVNPLVAPPYRYLARASEASGQLAAAIQACRALLLLDPPNPAEVHYDLARMLHAQNDPEARRQVLQALEEAPRYREALRLLRQMNDEPSLRSTTVDPRAPASGPRPPT